MTAASGKGEIGVRGDPETPGEGLGGTLPLPGARLASWGAGWRQEGGRAKVEGFPEAGRRGGRGSPGAGDGGVWRGGKAAPRAKRGRPPVARQAGAPQVLPDPSWLASERAEDRSLRAGGP